MFVNDENERIKRRYITWMRKAQGFAESTINGIEKALWLYDDFTGHQSYREFCQRTAVRFKEWLERRTHRGKPVSDSTTYHHLKHAKAFFTWLAGQPGFKSKISLDAVSYLCLDKKKVKALSAPRLVEYPSLEYVKSLTDSIVIKTEIDRRDRALIAFLLLSAMRDRAVATLPIGCCDPECGRITQDPKVGVETKFGKVMQTYMFRFDDALLGYVAEWHDFLTREKLFGLHDPFFPKSKTELEDGGGCFVSKRVEPVFWKTTGSIRDILKNRAGKAGLKYYHPHSFRHAAVALSTRAARTPEEMKAVSQNLGHENVATTLTTYGTLEIPRVEAIVRGLDYSDKSGQKKGMIPQADLDRFLRQYRENT